MPTCPCPAVGTMPIAGYATRYGSGRMKRYSPTRTQRRRLGRRLEVQSMSSSMSSGLSPTAHRVPRKPGGVTGRTYRSHIPTWPNRRVGEIRRQISLIGLDLLYPLFLSPIASRNLLLYQSLPTSILYWHAISRRQKMTRAWAQRYPLRPSTLELERWNLSASVAASPFRGLCVTGKAPTLHRAHTAGCGGARRVHDVVHLRL